MINKDTIAKNIKLKRKSSKLSQQNVAAFLDVSVNQYQRYENGKAKIAIDKLHLLSHYFDVPIDFFFENQNCTLPKTIFLNEDPAFYEHKSPLLQELITIFLEIKDQHLRKKIVIMAKLIANETNSLLEDKYD